MHKWTNDTTGHNRTISTGPTPGGELEDFHITLHYVEYPHAPNPRIGNGTRGAILDGHIIPLILRVPEMRDTLRELGKWLATNAEYMPESIYDDVQAFVWDIARLTEPTREESEAAEKHGA